MKTKVSDIKVDASSIALSSCSSPMMGAFLPGTAAVEAYTSHRWTACTQTYNLTLELRGHATLNTMAVCIASKSLHADGLVCTLPGVHRFADAHCHLCSMAQTTLDGCIGACPIEAQEKSEDHTRAKLNVRALQTGWFRTKLRMRTATGLLSCFKKRLPNLKASVVIVTLAPRRCQAPSMLCNVLILRTGITSALERPRRGFVGPGPPTHRKEDK